MRSSFRVAARAAPRLARGMKATTGIVGMAVEPNAKPILTGLYQKTLAMLGDVPAGDYKTTVEGLTKSRLAVIESTDDLTAIEAKIGCGQVEQLIEQAEDEIRLIPILLEARAFDPYDGSPAEEILTDLKRCARPLFYFSTRATAAPLAPPPAHSFFSLLFSHAGAGLCCSATTSRCAPRLTIRRRARWSSSCPPRRRRRRSRDAGRSCGGYVKYTARGAAANDSGNSAPRV